MQQGLFSTTFFSFGNAGSWEVSGKLWIYWATAIPITTISVVLWRIWLDYDDSIVQILKGYLWWAGQLWAKMRTHTARQEKPEP